MPSRGKIEKACMFFVRMANRKTVAHVTLYYSNRLNNIIYYVKNSSLREGK